MVQYLQMKTSLRFNTTKDRIFYDAINDMSVNPLFPHPMLLPEHGQKLAVAAFPRLVFSPGALRSLHLRLLVVFKGPLFIPAHVPALQKDLGGSAVVGADVHSELVILQQTGGEDKEPPKVLRVQVAAAAVVVTTVQECLVGGEKNAHCTRIEPG